MNRAFRNSNIKSLVFTSHNLIQPLSHENIVHVDDLGVKENIYIT